ncbi:MAG TPA: ferritin family protein [Thermoanaerobaculaceae bacterium]|nr:ferritin family protein [Thermoanaerobaculaceae bacterium]HRS15429.1 ferritin family protein [Thermoanaerobaculaceae bacterium]
MQTREVILEILRKAYQIEVDGHTFYAMTAARAQKPAVQELFEKLASDEVQHQAFLRDVAKGYDEKGLAAFRTGRASDWSAISDAVFSGRFREQAAGAEFELATLSIGMTLENNAIAYFTGAAAQATEKEVQEFYQFLADWEKQHLEALRNLYNAVRQDFWGEGRFSPF